MGGGCGALAAVSMEGETVPVLEEEAAHGTHLLSADCSTKGERRRDSRQPGVKCERGFLGASFQSTVDKLLIVRGEAR